MADFLEIGSSKNEDLLSSSPPRGCSETSGQACPSTRFSDHETPSHHEESKSSCGSNGGRVLSVIAFIILLIVFIAMWVGLFGGTYYGKHDSSGHRSGLFNSRTLSGLLVGIVVVFILLMLLVWVIDSNPHWGGWVGGILLFLVIILIICGAVGWAGRHGRRDSSSSH